MTLHISRDRYERRVPPGRRRRGCVQSGVDWPELDDDERLLHDMYHVGERSQAVLEELAACRRRLR